jgi:hypothetical protein
MFLQRLGRLEAASEAEPAAAAPPARTAAPTVAGRGASRATSWLSTVAASIAVAAAILFGALPVASWLAERPVAAPVVEPAPVDPLPVARGTESRIARARELHASGRLHDALRALDAVDVADPLRDDVDRLRADLQRELLGGVAAGQAR